MHRCVIVGAQAWGARADDMGTVNLESCRIERSGVCGVVSQGRGSALRAWRSA